MENFFSWEWQTGIICFAVYLAGISIISAIVAIADKIKAKKGGWRIPESRLILLAACGGSAAMYLAMRLIRHKTKHIKFMLGLPIIFLFQLIIILYVGWHFWGGN